MAWETMITNHNDGNFDVKEERSFHKAWFTKRLVLVKIGEKGNLKAVDINCFQNAHWHKLN